MNLYFRLLKVIITSLFRKRLKPFDVSVLKFRVLPNDIDLNIHMNDGRYVSIMDLGRIDMTMRNGLLKACIKNKWFPVVASVMVRYNRSINPFQKYELHSHTLCWDDKWFYILQRFIRGDKVMAIGIIKGAFLHKGSRVNTSDALNSVDSSIKSPPMPGWVKEWVSSDEEMRNFDNVN